MNLSALQRLIESEVPAWAWRGILGNVYYTPKHDERRRHARIVTDNPVLIRVVEPFSPIRWKGRVLDISKSGMLLAAPTPITPGSLVQLHMDQTSILAVVRHCRPGKEVGGAAVHYAGVEIQRVF